MRQNVCKEVAAEMIRVAGNTLKRVRICGSKRSREMQKTTENKVPLNLKKSKETFNMKDLTAKIEEAKEDETRALRNKVRWTVTCRLYSAARNCNSALLLRATTLCLRQYSF